MYRVIEAFEDAEDGRHPYEVGDPYPRKGHEPSDERMKALLGKGNARRRPLIAEERKQSEKKHK